MNEWKRERERDEVETNKEILNWMKRYNIPINIVFKLEFDEKVEVRVNVNAVFFNEMFSIKGLELAINWSNIGLKTYSNWWYEFYYGVYSEPN